MWSIASSRRSSSSTLRSLLRDVLLHEGPELAPPLPDIIGRLTACYHNLPADEDEQYYRGAVGSIDEPCGCSSQYRVERSYIQDTQTLPGNMLR